jgi:hypothetical protein
MFALIKYTLLDLIDVDKIIYELYSIVIMQTIREVGYFEKRLFSICISDQKYDLFKNTYRNNLILWFSIRDSCIRDNLCWKCSLSLDDKQVRYLYYGFNGCCQIHIEHDLSCLKCKRICTEIHYEKYHERCFMEWYNIACNFWINIKPGS